MVVKRPWFRIGARATKKSGARGVWKIPHSTLIWQHCPSFVKTSNVLFDGEERGQLSVNIGYCIFIYLRIGVICTKFVFFLQKVIKTHNNNFRYEHASDNNSTNCRGRNGKNI
jgi:hypothetical protein